MSLPWSEKDLKTTPIGADEIVLLDSEDSDPDTTNKRARLDTLPSSGEINTASNIGTGSQVFAQKSGFDLEFRTVIGETDKINTTQNTADITFSLGTDVVTTDKANTYGDFKQTFADNQLNIQNPLANFTYQITASAILDDRVLTLPLLTADDTFVTADFTQTLTNKTLTSPVISIIENSGTLTLPTGTDTLVARNSTDTLTNKTLTTPVISDIENSGNLTLPTGPETLVALTTTDTLSNKTLIAPVISTISNTGLLTLPTSTDVLVARNTSDTLTNKTFDANATGNSLSNVDVEDLADGQDGELITWDSSGNPATVSVGALGQVLTSQGTGNAPIFANSTTGTLSIVRLEGSDVSSNRTALNFLDTTDINFLVADDGGDNEAEISAAISLNYVGQTSIITLGTITTGTWHGDTVAVGFGGTGATTFTDNGVLVGNLTNPVSSTSAGTTGQVLTSNGSSSAPTFEDTQTLTLTDGSMFVGDENNDSRIIPVGFETKVDCRLATTTGGADIDLSTGTLLTIDNVVTSPGDRVLVKNQDTNPEENGIYIAATGAWSRSTDADTDGEVNMGMFTFITEGSENANSAWSLSTVDPIVLNTTDLMFEEFILSDVAHLGSPNTQNFTKSISVAETIFTKNTQVSQISTTTTEVFDLSDLPAPVSGIITLPSGLYNFKTDVDFGTNRIVFPTSAEIVMMGDNTFGTVITFTASSNTFMTGASLSAFRFESMDILMKGTNGQIFDFTDGEIQFVDFQFDFDVTATGTRTVGSVGGGGPLNTIDINQGFILNYIDGITFDVGSLTIGIATFVPDDIGTTFIVDGISNTAFFDAIGYLGDSSATIFNIDNSNTETINIANVFDFGTSIFYDAGGLDQTAPNVIATNNGSSSNSMTIAEARSGTPLVVDITTQSVAVALEDITPVADDWIEDPATEEFTVNTTSGLITFNGINNVTVSIQFQLTITPSGGGAQDFDTTISINGTPQTKSTISVTTATTGVGSYIGGIFTLSPADTIQLFISNESNTNDPTVTNTTILIQKAA